ncbi:MAG TPA: folate-binding protein YgfZ [Acidiphilium sp.]|uniref:CAF17-like 4Fe-4S cluster assembly/insertion protein YgfZ n=1 Tax=unclassified Acidiphilium TaxID=2617493 RepID=UPI000BDDAC07|nr:MULTISPECIES: folate-binding protein YgfZ [unclassified Acidiphilium]OYV55593.1 MAG: folate-binding protein YgfZ [Acidiphilium sp. 20-67-58]HQT60180.1 folate-binding protein YgfZ [Acidiphilium sp.]HQU10550.1 folate-binding protein YgfZ [Acidiphilium sp.]
MPVMTTIAYLPARGVIGIDGPDRVAFLQGLVSNDVTKAEPGRAVWSALLTPQGRYLAEFFILAAGESLLLEAPRASVAELIRRLSRFRLRSQVTLRDRSDEFAVHAAWGGAPPVTPPGAIIAADPRLPEAGHRILAPAPLAGAADEPAYLAHRLALGLPDHDDLEPEKTLLMEAGFGELHGIDWEKGCYMGQELTARTRYRGLVKRRLIPVDAEAELPVAGTITDGEREVGTLRTSLGRRGLALLRLDALGSKLCLDGIALTPDIPSWMTLPETATP